MTLFTSARLSLITLMLASATFSSACGDFGDDRKGFQGYWVGDLTVEQTRSGEVTRFNASHTVVEIDRSTDNLIISFENFLLEGFSCTVEAEVDSDGESFEIERSPCFADDAEELSIQGKGEIKGDDELTIELKIFLINRSNNGFNEEASAEYDLELL